MRDTSLDDFIGGGETDDGDGANDDGGEEETSDAVNVDPGVVDGEGTDPDGGEPGGDEGTEEGDVDVGGDIDDGGDVEGGSGAGRGGDVDVEDASGGDHEADPIQPAVSTYDWTPDGASCAECDAVVERRWRDEGELVCVDCKDW